MTDITGTIVRISRHFKPGDTCPSGVPLGDLAGQQGTIQGHSPKYNSSYLVEVSGQVYDIHDQDFRMINFRTELQELLNKYGKENVSDTPDYILAGYIVGCLDVFNKAVKTRDNWHSCDENPPEEAHEDTIEGGYDHPDQS